VDTRAGRLGQETRPSGLASVAWRLSPRAGLAEDVLRSGDEAVGRRRGRSAPPVGLNSELRRSVDGLLGRRELVAPSRLAADSSLPGAPVRGAPARGAPVRGAPARGAPARGVLARAPRSAVRSPPASAPELPGRLGRPVRRGLPAPEAKPPAMTSIPLKICKYVRAIRLPERPSRQIVSGDVLLSHAVARAVPSALRGLASGFGMGPGVSLSLWSPKLY
jgi:hypothetical protein